MFKNKSQELCFAGIVGFFVLLGLVVLVVPKVELVYKESYVMIPGFTQTIVSLSHFILAKWQVIFAFIFGNALVLWLYFSKTRIGRLLWRKSAGLIPRSEKPRELIVYGSILLLFALVWLPVILPLINPNW